MHPIFNSRATKAAILASGNFLSMCANILIAAVLTRVFLKSEYATYQQTFLAFNFVVPLLALGIPTALYFFIPQRRDSARSVVLENLVALSIGALGFTLFILLGGSEFLAWRFKNHELTDTLLLLTPYAFFELYSRAVGPCLMAHNLAHQVAIYSVATRILLFVLAVTAALVYGTTRSVIMAAVIAAGLRMVIGISLIWFATRETAWKPTSVGIRQQLKYGVPLGIAGVFGTLTLTLDKFIVASICDLEDFAVYAVGAFEIPIVGIVTGSVTAVLLTDLSSMFAENRLREATELWGRSALKCSMLLLPIMVGLFAIAPDVIALLFSEKYVDSVLPFRLYLLLLPIRIANYGSMIMSTGRSRLILLRAIVSFLLNACLSVVLVYGFGFIGAIVGTILVMYLWAVPFNLIVISRLWKTSAADVLPWKKLATVLFLSLVVAPVLTLDDFLGLESKTLVLGVLVPLYATILCGLLISFGLLSRDFPSLVIHKIQRRTSGSM